MLIRPAQPGDEAAIVAIVERAYGIYVERIGMRPGPMDADYPEKVRRGLVHIAEVDGEVVGLVVLVEASDHLLVENVAVAPERQGEGIGRAMLDHAEPAARAAGFDEIRLFTHSKMTENRAFYRRLGYRETGSRDEEGFDRVFLVRSLS